MSKPKPASRKTSDAQARDLAAALERCRRAEAALENNRRIEMIGRLGAGFAHDLNNLLGVISNSAHLLQRLVEDPAAQAPIAATFRSVEAATRLTGQLLRLADQRPPTVQALDPGQFLSGMHDLMTAVVGKRITASIRCARTTAGVLADPDQLELALLGLLQNSREALRSGGQVWIDARDADAAETAGLPPGPYVAISVSDDGVGMCDEVAERAFDAYFSNWSKRSASGLGLGRVQAFCHAAGGVARLASTPGLGTAVTLLLPATPSGAATLAPPSSDAAPAGQHSLLLVEDIEALADVTAALLATYGYRVRHASNAEQALAMVEADAGFDVVLSDIVMPGGIDGVELARQLRGRWPTLPIVLISGFSTALDRAVDFPLLRKPCSPDLLAATLQQAIAGATADRPA